MAAVGNTPRQSNSTEGIWAGYALGVDFGIEPLPPLQANLGARQANLHAKKPENVPSVPVWVLGVRQINWKTFRLSPGLGAEVV